jgi:hypothetical protein
MTVVAPRIPPGGITPIISGGAPYAGGAVTAQKRAAITA